MKKIDLEMFIVLMIVILVLIAMFYLTIVPYIKPSCI